MYSVMPGLVAVLQERENARESDSEDAPITRHPRIPLNQDFSESIAVPLVQLGDTDLDKPEWLCATMCLERIQERQVVQYDVVPTEERQVSRGSTRHPSQHTSTVLHVLDQHAEPEIGRKRPRERIVGMYVLKQRVGTSISNKEWLCQDPTCVVLGQLGQPLVSPGKARQNDPRLAFHTTEFVPGQGPVGPACVVLYYQHRFSLR